MLKVISFALISSLSISNHWIRNLRLYINNLTLISRSSMTLHEFGESFAHSGIHRELVNILKEIRVISDKIRSEDYAANIENDWKFAAMVLDRICLITFSLFTIVATVAVLAAAPHVIVK